MRAVLFLLLILSTSVVALEQAYVNDIADLLSPQEEAELTIFLDQLEQQTTLEFALVTQNTTQDIFQDSFDAAEELGLGKADTDNGLLLFIAIDSRQYFIQVGQGLEASIPDIIVNRVAQAQLVPAFQQEQYAVGITNTFQDLAGYALQDESVISEYSAYENQVDWPYLIFFLILLILGITGRLGFLPFMFMGGGNFSSRGFGGFGGGSFGGGGAGGRW